MQSTRKNTSRNDSQEGDKVLLNQERDDKLTTPFKQIPFIFVVEAGAVKCRRNVTHVTCELRQHPSTGQSPFNALCREHARLSKAHNSGI